MMFTLAICSATDGVYYLAFIDVIGQIFVLGALGDVHHVKLLVNRPRNLNFLCKKMDSSFDSISKSHMKAVLLIPYLNLHRKVRF